MIWTEHAVSYRRLDVEPQPEEAAVDCGPFLADVMAMGLFLGVIRFDWGSKVSGQARNHDL